MRNAIPVEAIASAVARRLATRGTARVPVDAIASAVARRLATRGRKTALASSVASAVARRLGLRPGQASLHRTIASAVARRLSRRGARGPRTSSFPIAAVASAITRRLVGAVQQGQELPTHEESAEPKPATGEAPTRKQEPTPAQKRP